MAKFSYFVVFTVILFSLSCDSPHKAGVNYLKASGGKLDLTDWDFYKHGPLPLDGEWLFIWGKFVPPLDFKSINEVVDPCRIVQIPSGWSDYSCSGATIGGTGYGTYRLLIKLGRDSSNLVLKIPDFGTSYSLYINGVFSASNGFPSAYKEQTIPEFRPQLFSLPEISETLDIVIHVANYKDRNGGFWKSLVLGKSKEIQSMREKKIALDLLLTGCLAIMGLYHIGLFILRRKDPSPLYFGIFCFLIGIRIVIMGERYFSHLFPQVGWETLLKVEYISYYLAVPFFGKFIHSLFPEESSLKAIYLIKLICGFCALIVLLTPSELFTPTLKLIQAVTVIGGVFYTISLGKAVYRRREGALIFIFGFVCLFITIVNDILYAEHLVSTGYILTYGMFAFIFSQSFSLSLRFSRAFKITETLTDTLEARVLERTEELNKTLKIIQNDLRLANDFQEKILPSAKIDFGGYFTDIRYQPMDQVGGDYYDITEIQNGILRIFLADATGHGVRAALMTMAIKASYDSVKHHTISPDELLSELNLETCSHYKGLSIYFTCVLVDIQLRTGKIFFSSAGHPPQIIQKKGSCAYLTRSGPIIGMHKEASYHLIEEELGYGDKLLLMTDGIYEEFNQNKIMFGEERVREILTNYGDSSITLAIDRILSAVQSHIGWKARQDDITILGIERLPESTT